MTKETMYRFQERLDREKYKLVDKGIGFCFVIREGKETTNVSAGLGGDMTMMLLRQLSDLYQFGVADKNKTSPEQFAESMKQNLLEYMKEHGT